MNHLDDLAGTDPAAPPVPQRNVFDSLAQWISRAGTGDRAALARLRPDALRPHELSALATALLHAGLSPDQWRSETWPRWALIAHGIALAGHAHGRVGAQLAQAGVSESRVAKLLTSQGPAFTQLLPRLLRLLASKGVAPDWRELGELVLAEADPDRKQTTESLRLRIAGPFYTEMAKSAKK